VETVPKRGGSYGWVWVEFRLVLIGSSFQLVRYGTTFFVRTV